MIRSSIRRRIAATVAVAMLPATLVLAAAPAEAGSKSSYKSSGRIASADWLEVGTLPGVAGNIHFGFMQIEDLGNGRANIFGFVDDLTCPPGVIPNGGGGGHLEEEPEPGPNGCTYEGGRSIENGTTTFTMDRKLNMATLTGTLRVFGGHGEGPVGQPRVNMILTGVGDTFSSSERGSFTDGTSTSRWSYSFSGRSATVSGAIGAMIFDNVEGEYSNAQMGSYRNMQRDRTK